MTQRHLFLALGLAALVVGVSPLAAQKRKPTPKTAAPQIEAKPSPTTACRLEVLASTPIAVMPARFYTMSDSLGWDDWGSKIRDPRSYLGTVDDELAFALKQSGVRGWVFPNDLLRAARRNPGYVTDPYSVSAEEVRLDVKRKDGGLHEPLASQVRSLVALTEARMVFVPVDVRIEKTKKGGRSVLDYVVLDARRSWLQCRGQVVGDTLSEMSPAVAASLATKLANQVIPPQQAGRRP